jgi:hypothetical protein
MINTYSINTIRTSSQCLTITDNNQTNLDITGDITIEAWIKLSSLPSALFNIVAKYGADVGNEHRSYYLGINANKQFEFTYSDNGTFTNHATRVVTTNALDSGDVGEWIHIAVTADVSEKASGVKFYINGIEDTNLTTVQNYAASIFNGEENFVIGANGGTIGGSFFNFFDGLIDEVRVSNIVRSGTYIATNYNQEITPDANHVGYWKFNNSALDETSNNNDLTLVNSPTYSTNVPFVGSAESPSPSATPSSSVSLSPSASPSSSQSPSSSPSSSQSPSSSESASESLSPSASESASESSSPSSSQSPSSSESSSQSASESLSPSSSISLSPSLSPSSSPSSSQSPSSSPSSSQSPSSSESSSQSPSSSVSASESLSPSASVSSSISPSPSLGYTDYTKGAYETLPTTDDDLETEYTSQDILDVAEKDNVRVGQTGTGYIIHQFRNFVGDHVNCQLEWEGQSSLAPSASTVYLQIYNRTTSEWETVDYDEVSDADTDFLLLYQVEDVTNYKDEAKIITCRVYQEAL